MILAACLIGLILVSFLMILWGAWRRYQDDKERKRFLAAYFGSWPPSKRNIFLIAGFYAGLIWLGIWLYEHRR